MGAVRCVQAVVSAQEAKEAGNCQLKGSTEGTLAFGVSADFICRGQGDRGSADKVIPSTKI